MAQPRRQFLRMVIGTAVAAIVPRAAGAQTYPARPARLFVGITAGSAPDIFARLLGQWLSERLASPSSSRTSRALAPISRPRRSCAHPRMATRRFW